MQARFKTAIVKILFRILAAYDTRITDRVRTLPLALVWLGYKKPTEQCPRRLEIAQRLLDTPRDRLHPTARTILKVFRRHIEDIRARRGMIDLQLFGIFNVLAIDIRAETRELESCMNLNSSPHAQPIFILLLYTLRPTTY